MRKVPRLLRLNNSLKSYGQGIKRLHTYPEYAFITIFSFHRFLSNHQSEEHLPPHLNARESEKHPPPHLNAIESEEHPPPHLNARESEESSRRRR